jgi:hypothetical protein
MRAAKKLSIALVLPLIALVGAALLAGCGGGSGSSGGGGDPASLAPQDAPVFVEANLAPDSAESEDLNELVNTAVGIENIGEYITEELEKSALGEGEKFNFEEEVEPWLGEKVGIALNEFDGTDFTGTTLALEVTDTGEAEAFVEKRVQEGNEEAEEGEVEGDKYYVTEDQESVIGVIGNYFAVAETKPLYEKLVKIDKEGKGGLDESTKFTDAMDAAESEGLAHVYVDIGGLIEKAGSQIPPETETFFDLTGIEPREATAVATLKAHSEQIELDLATNVTKAGTQVGDASALLESLPATALAGFASPEFGKSFGESINELDKQGIPGQIPPGELKSGLASAGINLEAIAESFGDLGGFVEGSSASNIGGAIVVETKGADEARNTVSNIGLLLRSAQTPGVTALSGNLTGFSVRSAELGKQPLVVAASGEKLVIAYGTKGAAQALRSQAKTLGSTPDFEAAKGALGSTPIGLFVDGGPALKLVKAMISPEEQAEFAQAEPFVEKIAYIGSGTESDGSTTTAKVIIGLQK